MNKEIECNKCNRNETIDPKTGNTPLMIYTEGVTSYDPTKEASWYECPICHLYLDEGDFDTSDEEYEQAREIQDGLY